MLQVMAQQVMARVFLHCAITGFPSFSFTFNQSAASIAEKGLFSSSDRELCPMTSAFAYDLYKVKLNHQAKNLGQRSLRHFIQKLLSGHSDTHTGPIALPGPLKWSMTTITRMWANAQRDGRPAEYWWRPVLNAAKFG